MRPHFPSPARLAIAIAIAWLASGCRAEPASKAPAALPHEPVVVDDPPPANEPVHPGTYDETEGSTDLSADIEAMWETGPRADGQPVSTNGAINAASRVFNTAELVGKTGNEVIALLGSPVNSSDSVYRSQPFWPLDGTALVYRFDNGYCGWQFTVYCEGDDQPVTRVVREWIH